MIYLAYSGNGVCERVSELSESGKTMDLCKMPERIQMIEQSIVPCYLFVYGSLMRGYNNHHLLRKSKFVSNAKTCSCFSMYADEYPFVLENIENVQIEGELYYILDIDSLIDIDTLEGHPIDYIRKICKVQISDKHEPLDSFIYFKVGDINTEGCEFISTGNFNDSELSKRLKIWNSL